LLLISPSAIATPRLPPPIMAIFLFIKPPHPPKEGF
jgi:hypothetical protein